MVRLNVGGKRFDVSLPTANAFGYLRGILAWGAREPDDDGIFVDRDPALFEILLQCVRTFTRPPQREIDNRKDELLSECAFYCLGDFLTDSIAGRISGFNMRPQDRKITFFERTGDVSLHDPFQTTFDQIPVAEHGPALLEPRGDERERVDCGTEAVMRARLNKLTNGLVDKLASAQGLLIAGGAVVHALLVGRQRCSDVDIFLRCAPEEGLSKLRAVYDAVRQLALDASQGAALRNLLVTRTTSSVTIFSCADRAVPPIQVSRVGCSIMCRSRRDRLALHRTDREAGPTEPSPR